jgi:secreted PhoX family phosphatase
MPLSRRGFLYAGAGIGFGAVAAGLVAIRRVPRPGRLARGLYGPLRPDPKRILDLPEGFSYRILQQRGERMSDGYRVPWQPDAMACFAGADGGSVVLMRNHECGTDKIMGPWFPGQPVAPQAYRPTGMGGVTRLVLDAKTFELRSSNLVLAGTLLNCAGGPSPWGWISCEETVVEGHGFAFLCRPDAATLAPPERLPGYGRYRHEACAIDPATHVAYLSEDRPDGCFYRFLPDDPAAPFVGRLQALAVPGRPGMLTAIGLRAGDRFEATWIDVADPTPADDSLRARTTAAGAAVFKRGEGLVWNDGAVYLAATTGGPTESGQIFRYRPDPGGRGGGTLELFAQAYGRDLLDMPDNLTMAPWGHLYACEDGLSGNHLRVFTPDGDVWDFARNAYSSGEFAGVCFSPDGRALFVNLQDEGWTLVVTGPWEAGGRYGREGRG